MKIMIFIEGTTFYTRPVLFLFSKHGYLPIGKAVQMVNDWYAAGHEIYLCSYVRNRRLHFIQSVLDHYDMKYTALVCRGTGETYADLVERIRPDVLIEDDCKSIGGEKNWCITGVSDEIKSHIRSIVVPEFGGIDHVKL